MASVEERADATRNRVRPLLSLTYELAIRHGKLKENPARLVAARPERNVRQGSVDDSQYSKLTQACPTVWLRAMLAVGCTYGWRDRGLTNFRVRQVDLAARKVPLEPGTTKNLEGRTIKLTGECYELVTACIVDKKQADYLFTREDGEPVRAYRHAWELLCARAGLGRIICKTCRAPGPTTGAASRRCPACAKPGQLGIYGYEGLLFRSPPQRSPQPGVRDRPAVRRHEDHRPSNGSRLSPLRHREPGGSGTSHRPDRAITSQFQK